MSRWKLQALAVAVLLSVSTSANATWSGYWTWVTQPPPPKWVWTWVWYAPTKGWTSSGPQTTSLAAADLGGADAGQPACCGITITGFGALDPKGLEFTGLLLTDFVVIRGGANTTGSDLKLDYVGKGPLTPGEPLGTMILTDPDADPSTEPPGDGLGFTETFSTGTGVVTESGRIFAVPEPATWALMLIGFGSVGATLRRRRTRPVTA